MGQKRGLGLRDRKGRGPGLIFRENLIFQIFPESLKID